MTVDTRWFKDRIKEMDLTQRSLSKRLGRDYAAVSKLINGKRKMGADEAVEVARFLEVPIDEVLRRFGVTAPTAGREDAPGVPIVGNISANCNITIETDAIISPTRFAQRPGDDSELAALVWHNAAGTADNWIAYYRPTGVVDPEAIGSLAVVGMGDAAATLARLGRGYLAGHYNVTSWDGAMPLHENIAVQWAAPVLWLHP